MRALQLVAVLAATAFFADARKQHKQGEKVRVVGIEIFLGYAVLCVLHGLLQLPAITV